MSEHVPSYCLIIALCSGCSKYSSLWLSVVVGRWCLAVAACAVWCLPMILHTP